MKPSLDQLYQTSRPSLSSLYSSSQALSAPEPGFAESLWKGFVSPVARVAANLRGVGLGLQSVGQIFDQKAFDRTQTDIRNLQTQGANVPLYGNAMPVGQNGSFGRKLADTVGVGAELASYAIPAGRAGTLAEQTFKGLALQGLKTGAVTGAQAGALYGAGTELQNPDSTVGSVALQTGLGGAIGAVGGGALGGTFALPGAALSHLAPDAASIVQKRLGELQKLEDNNATIRKVVAKQQGRGIDTKAILAQTDLLHGAVDDTGTLRTQNAIHELNGFIQPQEDVISKVLAQEGATMPLTQVQKELENAVHNSHLEGDALEQAYRKLNGELAGLARRADAEGNISISKIHDAKVSKYANLDYFNPASKNADKIIARTYKDIVERLTTSADVKALNQELSNHYAVLNLLEKLDGKKVDGGKLGKYFAKTIGAVVGSHFGPLGAIAGAEIGGRVKGAALATKLSGKTGGKLQQSEAMARAIQSSSEGSRQIPQASTIAPTINTIPATLPKTAEAASAVTPNMANGDAKLQSATNKKTGGASSPTTASKPSTAISTPTGKGALGRGDVSAQKAGTSGGFAEASAPALRKYLNEKYANSNMSGASSKATGQSSRAYGDYLYAQDRGAFDALLSDIKNGRNLTDEDVAGFRAQSSPSLPKELAPKWVAPKFTPTGNADFDGYVKGVYADFSKNQQSYLKKAQDLAPAGAEIVDVRLGGSYGKGVPKETSDLDLEIHYRGNIDPDVLAERIAGKIQSLDGSVFDAVPIKAKGTK